MTHKKYLQKVLKENIDLNKKRVIIVLPINPWQKVNILIFQIIVKQLKYIF